MRFVAVALIVTASILTGLPALAGDQPVTLNVHGQKIEGTLTLPDEVKSPPVVLMLHGFGGTRDEWKSPHVPKGLFGQAAETLSRQGIASLRIDFRGSGTSEGKFEDMTVESEIDDAVAALAFLRSRDDVDPKRVAILGMSLGGIVASAVAGRDDKDLSSLVLWNPGINPPAAFMALFGVEQIRKGLAGSDQPVELVLPNGTKMPLKRAFLESIYRVVPAAEITKYQGPLLLAVGTNDALIFPQPVTAEALLSYHPGKHELWEHPADHGFNIESDGDTVSALIARTADFLRAHFK